MKVEGIMKSVSGSILLIAAVLLAVGCSREEQEEVAERFATAGKALRGEVRESRYRQNHRQV